MPNLFEPFQLKDVTLRNRIGVSPMCQYSSEDGRATDWHLVHLGSRAVGGAGLIIAEATAVEARGRITPGDAGIWSDEHIAPLQRINTFIKEHGAISGIQLAHAGRKASAARPWEGDNSLADTEGGWDTLGASAVAFDTEKLWRIPKEMTKQDIQEVKEAFRGAALRSLEAGYEWLELHFAHGYLVHSFYSPLSNQRTDEYGGSFENRIRLALEITRIVKEVWPERLPLTARLSCSDWVEGGWNIDDSVELSKKLKAEGVDLIDCSSGFNTPNYQEYPFGSGWQVPFSERIRKEAEIATATVGFITNAMQADELIRNQRADIVLLAREMLRDPYWSHRAAVELRRKNVTTLPIQYASWL
ncbi:NADH:flavin oxidoreductase/NADH oxidase [Calothrix sp. 336/3]|uniref:NADH:flavin oxidoreductase/NADH oxidase n=1 Tax=Calothrix sp. 336/3 TaxID=1337936 RepID=UPI0004E314D1|nr:NADH:flavin oxidoreductase/NADH oxidase [Calothrix sp. 336/3]AKG24283.1 oxidoreductase [Calothrix sp. 336/3]